MDTNESVALARIEPQSTSAALQPLTIQEADWLAGRLATSGAVGKAQRAEAVLAVILTGRELGLTAMQSLRGIDLIDGKPALQASTMVALCLKHPEVCSYFEPIETTDTIAVYETKRVGREPKQMQYTIEQAKSAGLASKSNWKNHPADMLRARAAAKLARAVYPDLMLGMYTPDELDDAREHVPSTTRTVSPTNGAIVDAEIVPLRAAPQAQPADDREQRWRTAIDAAHDVAALGAVGVQIAADYPGVSAPSTLRDAWTARAAQLETQAPASSAPTPAAPDATTPEAQLPSALDAFAERMNLCETQPALDAVAAEVAKAVTAKLLDAQQRGLLLTVYEVVSKRIAARGQQVAA